MKKIVHTLPVTFATKEDATRAGGDKLVIAFPSPTGWLAMVAQMVEDDEW